MTGRPDPSPGHGERKETNDKEYNTGPLPALISGPRLTQSDLCGPSPPFIGWESCYVMRCGALVYKREKLGVFICLGVKFLKKNITISEYSLRFRLLGK